jgi:hypothetical protein
MSTIHGLSAGTDGRTPMAIVTAVLAAGAIAFLSGVRLRQRPGDLGAARAINSNPVLAGRSGPARQTAA